MGVLKSLLREAERQNYTIDKFLYDPRFKAAKLKVDNVALSVDELDKIEALNLSHNKELDNIRDLFLISAYTGLRYEDFTSIKPEHISEGYLRKYTSKTKEFVSIPILPTVSAILKKHGGTPEKVSPQDFNKGIKKVCELADISEEREKRETKGSKEVKTFVKKHQRITAHTARRSFATNSTLFGIPQNIVKQMTGHKSDAAFNNYVILDREQSANIVSNVWLKAIEERKTKNN